MTLLIVSIAVAMSVSFLCSVMEAALLSITPSKIALIAEKRPRIGSICRRFKEDIEKPIAVILILNTAAHTFGAAIAGAQFDKLFGSSYIWLFSLIFTVLMVQYTEILPKTLGVRFNRHGIAGTANTLRVLVWLLSPVIALVHLINRPFEPAENKSEEENDETIREIGALAAHARETHQLSSTQEQIIRNAPELADQVVTELMTPMDKIRMLSDTMSRDEVLSRIAQERHSRYPVCRNGNPGEIVGSLTARDLLFHTGEWRQLIRPVHYVNSGVSLLELLENVDGLDSRLLLVRDSGNRIAGMLTSNDILLHLAGKRFPVRQVA